MNAQLLKSEIVKRGLTQRKLASLLGMSKNTFSSRMTGKTPFDFEEAQRICELLKITDAKQKMLIFFNS